MKLALVNLTREAEPPLGLASMAGYLKQHAAFCHTVIIDRQDPMPALRKEQPDLVGISALSFMFPAANRLAAQIKNKLRVPVIVGGYHITALPGHLAQSNFDVGVLGEGEQTAAELVTCAHATGGLKPEDLRSIRGLVFKNENGHNEQTPDRPLIEPLDVIPMPARDFLNMENVYLLPRRAGFSQPGIYAAMLTSRGCPYHCAFCSPSRFWNGFRTCSPVHVVDEMEHLLDRYRVDGVVIWDDLFAVNRERLADIVALAETRGLPRRLQCFVFSRTNLIHQDTADLLHRLNVSAIFFGLESGSESVLSYLKKGSVTVDDNLRALRLCKQYGMRTIGTVIVGAPEETDADIDETLALIQRPELDQAIVCHLKPLPGTEVWEHAKGVGVVSEDIDWPYDRLSSWAFDPGLVLTQHLSAQHLQERYEELTAAARRKHSRTGLRVQDWLRLLRPRLAGSMLLHWRTYAHRLRRHA